jgi:hypothetical protein
MKRFIALGAIVLVGAVAFQVLARGPRRRVGSAVRQRMLKRMERMMAGLPENSPPRLVMSVLPRLREQNDEILRELREQNDLLRERAGHAGVLNPRA